MYLCNTLSSRAHNHHIIKVKLLENCARNVLLYYRVYYERLEKCIDFTSHDVIVINIIIVLIK